MENKNNHKGAGQQGQPTDNQGQEHNTGNKDKNSGTHR